MGFFNLPTNFERGDEVKKNKPVHNCSNCGQWEKCNSPKIPYIGKGEKGILIIGDNVSLTEDRNNNEEHGATYAFLKRYLKSVGISLENDCWYTHATKCYLKGVDGKKAVMGKKMQSGCHSLLMNEIFTLKPKVIVPTSQSAFNILLYDRLGGRASSSIYDYAGECIPDQKLKTWVLPIYDAKMVREEDDKKFNKFEQLFINQLSTILDYVDKPFKAIDISGCKTTKNEDIALSWLNEIEDWDLVSFDYETTGLKPHRKGQKIYCISISDGKKSYCFPNFESNTFQKAIKRFLTNDSIKIAHNASFERAWSLVKYGVEVKNLIHDTMIGQHCFHNSKPTGLKFLVYAKYGIMGYDECEEFLKPMQAEKDKYGANAINFINDAPLWKLLQYCAEDSLYTVWLYHDIVKKLDPEHQMVGYKFFMKAIRALDDASQVGFTIRMDQLAKVKKEIEDRLEPILKQIMDHDLIRTKWDWNKSFNPASDACVSTLVYDILKFPVEVYTDRDIPAVDGEALSKMVDKNDFIPLLLEYRRWQKALGTYIGQIEKEVVDGIAHPFFSLHNVKTFRGASQNFNAQNFPKRDKEVYHAIKSILGVPQGFKMAEYDYKGLEVGGSGSISGDPALIRYVNDTSLDMHLDVACDMFLLPRERVNKRLRNAVKGAFVFAEFYGSFYELTAKGVWNEINITNAVDQFGFNVVEHLASKGIDTYEKWEAHVQEQENNLWNKRFPAYQKFRKATYAEFCEKNFVDYVNGFRYQQPASRNEVLNAVVQGASFHIQLWTFTEITREIKERKLRSRLIAQVHDSLVFAIAPEEEALIDYLVWLYGTQKVKEHFKWIVTELMIEKSISEVDGDWASLKEIGYVNGSYFTNE